MNKVGKEGVMYPEALRDIGTRWGVDFPRLLRSLLPGCLILVPKPEAEDTVTGQVGSLITCEVKIKMKGDAEAG